MKQLIYISALLLATTGVFAKSLITCELEYRDDLPAEVFTERGDMHVISSDGNIRLSVTKIGLNKQVKISDCRNGEMHTSATFKDGNAHVVSHANGVYVSAMCYNGKPRKVTRKLE